VISQRRPLTELQLHIQGTVGTYEKDPWKIGILDHPWKMIWSVRSMQLLLGSLIPRHLGETPATIVANAVWEHWQRGQSQFQSYLRRRVGFLVYKSRDGHAQQPDGFLHWEECLLQLSQNASVVAQGCAEFFVRLNRSESFVHTRSSAGFTIITSGFEFSMHTGGYEMCGSLKTHLPTYSCGIASDR
jgi:hypothetical protein